MRSVGGEVEVRRELQDGDLGRARAGGGDDDVHDGPEGHGHEAEEGVYMIFIHISLITETLDGEDAAERTAADDDDDGGDCLEKC